MLCLPSKMKMSKISNFKNCWFLTFSFLMAGTAFLKLLNSAILNPGQTLNSIFFIFGYHVLYFLYIFLFFWYVAWSFWTVYSKKLDSLSYFYMLWSLWWTTSATFIFCGHFGGQPQLLLYCWVNPYTEGPAEAQNWKMLVCWSAALAPLYCCSRNKTRDRDHQTSRGPKLKNAGLLVCCLGS